MVTNLGVVSDVELRFDDRLRYNLTWEWRLRSMSWESLCGGAVSMHFVRNVCVILMTLLGVEGLHVQVTVPFFLIRMKRVRNLMD